MSILSNMTPEALKALSAGQVQALEAALRAEIIDGVSQTGGHLASNLGMVEMTLALHRVFDSPRDKMIFDVGHQCYAHKLLTGRQDRFSTLRQYGGLSGFPRIIESPHDAYGTGHASTALSAALGMARARDIKGEDYHIIAVVGDGALTGGMCYEALNDLGSRKTPLIIILNDNQMSIAPNVGAVSQYLTYMRLSKGWMNIKKSITRFLGRFPRVGKRLENVARQLKNHVRNVFVRDTYFKKFGLRYIGPVDGHDERRLERIFSKAKDLDEPVLIHIVTQKGQGYEPALNAPDKMHGTPPFDPLDGKPKSTSQAASFGKAAGAAVAQLAVEDARVVAITAAMADATGMSALRAQTPERLFDVGIAEEHAVTLAAGMAVGGLRPFVAIYDTFLQRAFDQIVVDVALQNLPVCFLVDRLGLGGEDGPSHHGVFGVAFTRAVPNLHVLSPRNTEELADMIRFAYAHPGPVVIRYPRQEGQLQRDCPYQGFEAGHWESLKEGGDLSILSYSQLLDEALMAAELLGREGIRASVINASTQKPLDDVFLSQTVKSNKPIVVMEEHQAIGGLGSATGEWLHQHGASTPLLVLALPDSFTTHGDRASLLKEQGLDAESAARAIKTRFFHER